MKEKNMDTFRRSWGRGKRAERTDRVTAFEFRAGLVYAYAHALEKILNAS